MNSKTFSQPQVLTRCTPAALPPPLSFKQQGCRTQALLSPFCLGRSDLCVPLASQVQDQGPVTGSSPSPSWGSQRTKSQSVGSLGPAWGLVSFTCSFYCYSGTVTEDNRSRECWKDSWLVTDPQRRGHTTQWGHMGRHQGGSGGRGNVGGSDQQLLLWFLKEGTGEAGQAGEDWLI